MKIMSTDELEASLRSEEDFAVLDVREHMEVARGMIPNAIHIPLGELENRLDELNKQTKYAIICRSGNRSGLASQFLNSLGYNTYNVVGGMIDWHGKVTTSIKLTKR